ncbi:VOC family protein [Cohnella sp. WQ 127256]|uniref:VOC family protein n=1 Tax=Cohnella sp. WQ 127256 TaxID=2938790 RepID=UPI002117DB75|nr:VOC family protein [Cohnella sp. WQ 127256]
MDEQLGDKGVKLGTTIQVRLVTDLKKSQLFYRDVLGCKIDDWGHAERDGMVFILQQAANAEDVRPNAPSQKRSDYPTEWEGPEYGWDTFVHVDWNDFDSIMEEIQSKLGSVAIEVLTGSHGNWEFMNAYIQDPDKYNIVLGAMRQVKIQI